jgi:hypothetical protein
MTTKTTYRHLPCARSDADESHYGWGDPAPRYYRRVAVEADGSVLAWDSIAESYTRCHRLSEAQQDEARRLARYPERRAPAA